MTNLISSHYSISKTWRFPLFHERKKEIVSTPNKYHTHVIISYELVILFRTKFCSVPRTSTVKTVSNIEYNLLKKHVSLKNICVLISSCSSIIGLYVSWILKNSHDLTCWNHHMLKWCDKKNEHQKARDFGTG